MDNERCECCSGNDSIWFASRFAYAGMNWSLETVSVIKKYMLALIGKVLAR